MLWLNGASIMALMTSGDASASPMPSSPSSVRTRTSATSWQLAVFCWTDSTRRIWQMTWSIFMGISVCAVAAEVTRRKHYGKSPPRYLGGYEAKALLNISILFGTAMSGFSFPSNSSDT